MIVPKTGRKFGFSVLSATHAVLCALQTGKTLKDYDSGPEEHRSAREAVIGITFG
jgi:hypothetical protein